MSADLTSRQQILLWDLLSRGGTALQKDLKPDVKPVDREPLTRGRHLSVTKEKGGALRLTLEDAGWASLASQAPALLKTGEGSKYDRPILQFVLTCIQRYAADHHVAFAAIFAGSSQQQKRDDIRQEDGPDAAAVEAQIVKTFVSLAGNPARDSVGLTRVRAALGHIERPTLDDALKKMRNAGRATLIRLDNPRDIAAESAAAITIRDQVFHKLWIDR